jgi:hypothetical protein
MVPPGPQIISNFYLSAFLDSIMNSGYTIFVIRSSKPNFKLPLANKQLFTDKPYQKHQMYFTEREIDIWHK